MSQGDAWAAYCRIGWGDPLAPASVGEEGTG